MFYDQDKPKSTVRLKDFSKFTTADFPHITAEEISDRSKGDFLSKALAMVQTGWFVLQCIGRYHQGLPLTQMELATVAFAALNIMTYAFWWKKPLNVERPFRVQWNEKYEGSESGGSGDKFGMWTVLRRVLIFPFMPFERMARGDDRIELGAKRVPTFYPRRPEKLHWKGALAGIVVATIFGGIHCVAWDYQFPAANDASNSVELFFWRVGCVIITAFPLFICGLVVIIEWLKSFDSHFAHAVSIIPVLAGGICGFLYVLARVALLILAYKSLDVLPHAAYRDVYWTSFIPHV